MFGPKLRTWLYALPLSLLVACVGPGSSSTQDGLVHVTLQGSFQKQLLTPGGLGSVVENPARYAYAEVRAVSDNSLIANGYLGADGAGSVDLSPNIKVYLRVFAAYQVPVQGSSNDFVLRGSVVNASYFTSTPFSQTSDWYVDSDAVLPAPGTLSVRANLSNRIAGAFNVADQAVAFGLKIRDLEPSLRLPNLHTYWTTSSNPNDQTRTYPTVLFDSTGKVSTSSAGRALFTHAVYGLQNGGAWTESDEWDDGTLVETFAHLLFANYSLRQDGSSPLSLLRLDNENAYVSRYRPTEPSVSFTGGFCDFLAGAALNTPQILDSYRDGSGVFRVENFDLSRHDQIDASYRTEFTRGSVATTLWGAWKNAGVPLQTLWQAARSSDFNGAALACYPTYLTALQTAAPGSWNSVLNQLAAESIPAPDTAYFSGTDLWTTVALPAGPVTGTLRSYAKADQHFYDYAPWLTNYNQSLNFRFVVGTPRGLTLTMTPLDGQDFELDLLGPQGYISASYAAPFGGTRTLSPQNLPAGTYVARVRVNPDAPATTGSYRFRLTIN